MNKYLNPLALMLSLSALGLVVFHNAPNDNTAHKHETAYERVIRTRVLRCGYALWPMAEDMDPNTKQLKGIVPEFTEALADKLGLKIEWVEEIQWGQQPEALQSGKIDAICSSDGPWVYTSSTVLDFTEPMAYSPVYLYGRKGETRFKNTTSLNSPDVTLSAMDGDISMTLAVEKFPRVHRLEIPSSGDPSLVTMNVLSGKADLVIEDAPTAERANGPHDEKLERLSPTPYAVINSSFSVAKGEGDLLHMLNQGFLLLQQLGISDAILNKYDPEHKLFYRPKKLWDNGQG